MHELSIASAIIDSVEREMAQRPGGRCVRVGVRVGELSGVDPEALEFGFEALVKSSGMPNAALEIEFCPRRQQCPSCGETFKAEASSTRCPRCTEPNTCCVGGTELDIKFLDVEGP